MGLPQVPSQSGAFEQVMHFTSFCYYKHDYRKPKLKKGVAAVQSWLAEYGLQVGFSRSLPYSKILSAADLTRPVPSQAKLPLPQGTLSRMLKLVPPDSHDDNVIRCALVIAYFAAMRVSEYSAPLTTMPAANATPVLQVSNFSAEKARDGSHALKITFFASKTNKNRSRESVVLPCGCDLDGACAFVEYHRLLDDYQNVKPSDFIFVWSNGTMMSSQHVGIFLANLLIRLDLDPTLYSTHSLRKTLVTDAILHGCPDSVIMNIGRWKSYNSMLSYINLDPQRMLDVRRELDKQWATNDILGAQRIQVQNRAAHIKHRNRS